MRPGESPTPRWLLRSYPGVLPKSFSLISDGLQGELFMAGGMGFAHRQGSSWCRVKLKIGNRKLVLRPTFVLSTPQMVKLGQPGASFEKPEERTTNPSLSSALLRDSLCTSFMDSAVKEASVSNRKERGCRKWASNTTEKHRAIEKE